VDELDSGEHALRDAASELAATVEGIQASPGFRRRLVRRSDEAIVVDLVHDTSVRGEAPIVQVGHIRVDPPEEILANKLTTLLARTEVRDLVDVAALEAQGYARAAGVGMGELIRLLDFNVLVTLASA
jgi:hypothetical protein